MGGSDATGPSAGPASVFTGAARSLHAVTRKSRSTYTGRQPQNRVMAPLCPRLSWLLKHTDCLHANIYRCTSHGFYRRPHLWKRSLGAVGQLLLPQHAPARSFAASAHGSSSDGHDVTEKLWSVYHKTKNQTEGISNRRDVIVDHQISAPPCLLKLTFNHGPHRLLYRGFYFNKPHIMHQLQERKIQRMV